MQSTSSFTHSPPWSRMAVAVVAVTVLAAVASLVGAPSALADNVWDVDCSAPDLVSAIQQADTAGSGTVNLAAGCTYTFTAPAGGSVDALPAIVGLSGPLTINGNGATLARSAAPGTPQFRLMQVGADPGTGTLDVTIDDLTVTGGYVPDGDIGGGGIQQLTPGLTLRDDTISDNSAPTCGGGVESKGGGLTMSDSTVTGNTQRSKTISTTGLCGGGAFGGGGGLLVGGTTRITNSTIADNTANFGGGGIYAQGADSGHTGGPNQAAITLLQNDTIIDNVGVPTTGLVDGGGGIWSATDVRLVNDTIAGNTPTQLAQFGADSSTASNYYMQGSVLVGSCHLENGGALMSQGANVLIAHAVGCPADEVSDWPALNWCPPAGCPPDVTAATSAGLDPLASNGGPTRTEAISTSSPAVGLEPAGNCPATDQRGAIRPQAGAGDCDAGAYEIQTIPTAVSYSGPASGTAGTPVTLSATLTHPDAAAGVPTPAGGGVADQPLAITVGAQSCSATTDASGVASCRLTLNDVAAGGSYPVAVRFAGGADGVGSDLLAASADTGHTLTVPTPAAPPPPRGGTGPSTGGSSRSPGGGQATSAPRIVIDSRRVVVRHHRASMKVRCRGPRGAVCRGTLTVTIRIHPWLHDRRARERTRTVVLARGRFRLTAGRHRSVTVVLDRRGRALIARARGHRIAATATAVMASRRSSAAHRRIVIERRPVAGSGPSAGGVSRSPAR